MASDARWELTILEIVHEFYSQLLQDVLHEPVLLPRVVEPETLRLPQDLDKSYDDMRSWLKLLDMAITPEMIRKSLTSTLDQDLAEALLRYYARKQSHTDYDRDKTDFVVTFLYKHPRVAGQWQQTGLSMDGVAPMPPFEIALMEVLGDADLPELSADESRWLDELQFLADDADNIDDFDRLIEAGIMQKARKIKHTFGPAFYHPHALSVIGTYNERFGKRFATLLRKATQQIHEYAAAVQNSGGSLSTRVDGDVTVEHLAKLKHETVAGTEYRRAQEQMRYVAKLKKAVDSRRHKAKSSVPAAPVPARAVATPQPTAPAAVVANVPLQVSHSADAERAAQELSRTKAVEDSIRAWVRAAEAGCRHIVPMKFGNFVLTPLETDAFLSDHYQEKSFRGDKARAITRAAATTARIMAEVEEFRQRQTSSHLWRPHADSLLTLANLAASAAEEANRVAQLAAQRGLVEQEKAVNAAIDKLRARAGLIATTLVTVGIHIEPEPIPAS